jgi:hypothetical protein
MAEYVRISPAKVDKPIQHMILKDLPVQKLVFLPLYAVANLGLAFKQ